MRRVTRRQIADLPSEASISVSAPHEVHASWLNFIHPAEDAATILEPLLSAIGHEGTVVAPTFTFGFIRTGTYDAAETPSVRDGLTRGGHQASSLFATQPPHHTVECSHRCAGS